MHSGLKIAVVGLIGGWSSERLADAAAERTGGRALIEMERVRFDVAEGKAYYNGKDLSEFDALIVKKLGTRYSPDLLNRLEILRYLDETEQVKVFSSPYGIGRAIDRMSCTLTLRQASIPLPETVITEDLNEAQDAVERFGEAILKPLFTSKARGMRLVSADDHLRSELVSYQQEGNQVIYIQRKLPTLERDLGLTFIGGEYIAAYARVNSGNSWNTTTVNGGHYEAADPSPELIEIGRKAQEPFGLAFTGVDIAVSGGGPVVFEVSAFGGFRGLVEGCGIDPAGRFVDYVIRQVNNV
jgi:ribosomal protein S6--L-glutamate ligase